MNDQELNYQTERASKYRELSKVRNEIYAAIKTITAEDKTGPCGQGPFTGNASESRQVAYMRIGFSCTRGGADPVEIYIADLHIEAWDLGRALESMLRAALVPVNEAIEKL